MFAFRGWAGSPIRMMIRLSARMYISRDRSKCLRGKNSREAEARAAIPPIFHRVDDRTLRGRVPQEQEPGPRFHTVPRAQGGVRDRLPATDPGEWRAVGTSLP